MGNRMSYPIESMILIHDISALSILLFLWVCPSSCAVDMSTIPLRP